MEEVKKQEQELLENQSIPLRNYLMKHVMPTLTQGLIESCKVRPDDAIDYLVSCDFPKSRDELVLVMVVQYFDFDKGGQ